MERTEHAPSTMTNLLYTLIAVAPLALLACQTASTTDSPATTGGTNGGGGFGGGSGNDDDTGYSSDDSGYIDDTGTGAPESCLLTITNSTGATFYELYVADSSASESGPNFLGADVLIDGDSFVLVVDPNPGSYYSAGAVDAQGNGYLAEEFDWCSDGEDLAYEFTAVDLVEDSGGGASGGGGSADPVATARGASCDPNRYTLDDVFYAWATWEGDFLATKVKVTAPDGAEYDYPMTLLNGYWSAEIMADDIDSDCDNASLTRFRHCAQYASDWLWYCYDYVTAEVI
jgi:hypothetical protein